MEVVVVVEVVVFVIVVVVAIVTVLHVVVCILVTDIFIYERIGLDGAGGHGAPPLSGPRCTLE